MITHSSVIRDVPLAPFTTYKVGGSADYFSEPDGLEELRSVLESAPAGMQIFVLGRGSNILVSDAGVRGMVIRLGRGFSGIDVRSDGMIVSGAAATLPTLARASVAAGRSGLEFYVGIPGSVGGAVRMNAGGHGSDTAAVLESTMILSVATRELAMRQAHTLDLRYRHSNITDGEVVVQATFATSERDPVEGEKVLRDITRWRKEHQPGGTFNAGSVFKNPPDSSAGSIIDDLGLKGTAVGPVSVSEVHANFFVATKEATASDILLFVNTIRDTVSDRTGIELEPEIRFVGDFDEQGATV